MKRIPPAHLVQCTFCGDDMDTRDYGIFQFVSGWIEQRRTGGANAIALPKRKHAYTCATCMDRLKHHISPQQRTIFDALADDE